MNVPANRRDVASRRVIAWTLLVAVGTANIAGNAFGLYRQFWWFDRVLHACTILALTFWLATSEFGTALNKNRGGGVLFVVLVVSAAVALGALWEVAKWGFDEVESGDLIKGKHDTLLDIMINTAGALLTRMMFLKLAPSPSQA